MNNYVITPECFRNEYMHSYHEQYSDPSLSKNLKWIEPYFYDYWMNRENKENSLIYLPIFWTCYYKFDSDSLGHEELKKFMMNNLDPDKKYFTVLQGSDGFLGDIPYNILTFASGTRVDRGITIPLVSPYTDKYRSNILNTNRDIFCSFIGIIVGTNDWNGIKSDMVERLEEDNKYYFRTLYYEETVEIMKRSVFTLCPRGFGPTSYRLYEAIAFGSIPIYIWGEYNLLPYQNELNWDDFSVIVHYSDMDKIKDIIENMSVDEINRKREKLIELYDNYFSMDAVCRYICKEVII